ncbi:MAG TPA: isoprenylcysteine carboxylmethyltransferase family protein [Rhizomicrobium sp.]
MLKLPPPIWAFIYLIVAAVVSALFPWRALVDLRVLWGGILLAIGGFALSFAAFSLFQRRGTEINPTSEANKLLVIEGPFRFTRNPMYLGLVIFTLGIAFCVGSLPMFVVPVLVFATANLAHIPFEEAKMRRQFGASFDDYTHKVRRWI